MITFVVPGKPKAWQRARRRGSRYFTDPEMAMYQKTIKWCAKGAGVQELSGPVQLLVEVYLAIPKSFNNTQRLDAMQRRLRPIVRPDTDNVLKTVADALNGIAYADDNQVVDIAVSKFYGEPMIRVKVGEA